MLETCWFLFVRVMTAKKFFYSFERPGSAYKRLKKLTSFNNTARNHKFKKLLTSWIFVGAFYLWWFDTNRFTNLKQYWTYLHLTKQCMFVSLKLARKRHSLSSKVFSEIVHLTFWNVIFSIRSSSTLLNKLEALLTLLIKYIFSITFFVF